MTKTLEIFRKSDLMVGMHKATMGSALFAATALLIAGCSGGQGTPGQPAGEADNGALKSFDPCTALPADQVQSFGGSFPGVPSDLGVGEVGCDFRGQDVEFGVLKAETSDEKYWQGQRDQFDQFTPNQVGAHSGFAGIALGGKGLGGCRQIMYVGSGSVIVDITYSSDKMPSDEETCGKAKEIAQAVESKLPK
ncbi:DUF3558 domain-containing protein [Saccharopolyspora dendranthemae]|uniref:Uncharacterized protein DUF3558 n=1 Tax=Saccharopolyspora dendranthemae TaxID=1181886 RepID=A0A561U139_9PSEU|nr:DUF3558 domain-containing protein [Saccharopolyspora dendranthemae]TWF93082.1 uncharacterized protein DUF3558 [Saccharopolyspora dendranthemae]